MRPQFDRDFDKVRRIRWAPLSFWYAVGEWREYISENDPYALVIGAGAHSSSFARRQNRKAFGEFKTWVMKQSLRHRSISALYSDSAGQCPWCTKACRIRTCDSPLLENRQIRSWCVLLIAVARTQQARSFRSWWCWILLTSELGGSLRNRKTLNSTSQAIAHFIATNYRQRNQRGAAKKL